MEHICKFTIPVSYRSISPDNSKTHDLITVVLFCSYGCGNYIIKQFEVYKERNLNNDDKSIKDMQDYQKELFDEAIKSNLNKLEKFPNDEIMKRKQEEILADKIEEDFEKEKEN